MGAIINIYQNALLGKHGLYFSFYSTFQFEYILERTAEKINKWEHFK